MKYCFLVLLLLVAVVQESSGYELDIRMPYVSAPKADALLCTSIAVDPSKSSYILEYVPHASSEVAHHMMLYGCGRPGSPKSSWLCGEMDDRSDDSVCSDGYRQVVYAWANDAPSKKLPPGVGFRVGRESVVQHLVLQLHYRAAAQAGETDNSGLTLRLTDKKQPMQLGYYILGTSGFIPPRQPEFHMETACVYDYNDTIIPIGFRTHSHRLGVVTSGYLIRNTSTEDEVWTELGRMSPQRAQMFYKVTAQGLQIRNGDILAARCSMNSMSRDEVTIIGPTNHDEMCNFYLMFATENTEKLHVRYCFRDAQRFQWRKYFRHVPPLASSLAGL